MDNSKPQNPEQQSESREKCRNETCDYLENPEIKNFIVGEFGSVDQCKPVKNKEYGYDYPNLVPDQQDQCKQTTGCQRNEKIGKHSP